MRLIPLVALLTGGCAQAQIRPSTECVTSCGLHMQTNKCEALQVAENKIVAAYHKDVALWADADLCKGLEGWHLRVHRPTEADSLTCGAHSWTMDLGGGPPLCVVGYTHTEEHRVEIETDDFLNSSLAHELGHVFQQLLGGAGHCAWKDMGITQAIKEATDGRDTWLPGKNKDVGCRI
jgi:hypothetical protein